MISPLEIRNLKEQHALEITWPSNQVQQYSYALLRGFCPCAVCQGHGGGPKKYIQSRQKSGADEEGYWEIFNKRLSNV